METLLPGIGILNKTEIIIHPDWTNTLILIGLISLFFGLFVIVFGKRIPYTVVGGIIALIGLIVLLTGGLCSDIIDIPTGEYTYQVTIDETVSLTEFYERYEVLDQEGKIWTIKEKHEQN